MSDAEEDSLRLRENASFKSLPTALRAWILASPNATHDFAQFFRDGGEFDMSRDVGLPQYLPRDRPQIAFDRQEWQKMREHGPAEYGLLRMFGTLAHEIGHHRFNTGVTPFTGATEEDYVVYRSQLEAEAIFNAFPIFRDLRDEPAFKNSMPFNSIGYLQGIELAQLYRQWDSGQLDREQVVAHIASRVADAPYTRPNPPPDEDRDGRGTHRDAYLHDYRRYIDKSPDNAAPAAPIDAADRALLERIHAAARATGRWSPQQCDNIAAAGLLAFKSDPLCRRLDLIAFGAPEAGGESRLFLVYAPFGEREPRFHVRLDAEAASRQPAAVALAQVAQAPAAQETLQPPGPRIA